MSAVWFQTRFWKAYWVTMRPYLCFVSGAAGLLGQVYADNLRLWPVVATTCTLFSVYGFGQALTDVFQTDTDALSSPYRPLVRGEVSGRQVLWTSVILLMVCGVILGWLAPTTCVLGVLQVLGLWAYTFFKKRFWGGPPWNSWIVALVPALGYLAHTAGGRMNIPELMLRSPQLLWACGAVFFSYQVFVLIGYLKDVEADRATGYTTLAVKFGRQATVCVSAVSAVLSWLFGLGALRGPLAVIDWRHALFFFLAAGAVGESVRCHILAWRVQDDHLAYPAVASSVRAYIWLCAALTLGQASSCAYFPFVACAVLTTVLGFEYALRARPFGAQI